jgi:plastocyanin
MRPQSLLVGTAVAAVCALAACSSSTSPSGSAGGAGGNSNTITGSTTTTGGAYGTGGNYFFSPNPDTVAAGSVITFSMGGVPHSVHFISVPNGAVTPDSVALLANGTATRTLTTPGTYTIECFNHMFMGTIVVH